MNTAKYTSKTNLNRNNGRLEISGIITELTIVNKKHNKKNI